MDKFYYVLRLNNSNIENAFVNGLYDVKEIGVETGRDNICLVHGVGNAIRVTDALNLAYNKQD